MTRFFGWFVPVALAIVMYLIVDSSLETWESRRR